MEAVDGYKLLSQRVWDIVMVDARSGNATDEIASPDSPNDLVEFLSHQPPPVGVHAYLKSRVFKNGRRPLDRVDLGDESAVDDPRSVEDAVALAAGTTPGQSSCSS